MIPIFLVYLLKVSISILLLMLLFKAALAADHTFARNRFYLLLAILWSVTVPILGTFYSAPTAIKSLTDVYQVILPAVTITPDGIENTNGIAWGDPYAIVLTIYLTGLGIFLIRMLSSYLRLGYIIASSKRTYIENHTVFVTNQAVAPFAFFGWIIFPEKLLSHRDLSKMILHEQEHCRQLHSVDLILTELFTVFQWFNPAAWMLKKLITENHEFTADQAVLNLGVNSYEYQASLVNATVGREVIPVSHFSLILIKKRIIMINSKSNLKWLRVKSLLVPVAFIGALALTSFTVEQGSKAINPTIPSFDNETLDGSQAVKTTVSTKSIAVAPKSTSTSIVQKKQKKEFATSKIDGEDVFSVVETMPQFKGDSDQSIVNVQRYLIKTLQYPEIAKEKGIHGKVFVSFVVDKRGKVRDPKVIKGADPILDKEALRVVSLMPSWVPGKQNGKNVNVQFTLPVMFALDGKSDKAKPEVYINGELFKGDMDSIDPSKIDKVNVIKNSKKDPSVKDKIEVTLKPGETIESSKKK